jgi:hypothetical protein
VEPPDVVLLDSGPLGLVSHPNAEKINAEAIEWLEALLSGGVSVLVAEIADYEVRRELLRAGRQRGVRRLDESKEAKLDIVLSQPGPCSPLPGCGQTLASNANPPPQIRRSTPM